MLKRRRDMNQIRNTQLSGRRHRCRNVSYTVQCQLRFARARLNAARRRSREEKLTLRKAREHLRAFSAMEFPPALAAFHGLGPKPFHLYSSIGFDKLHTVDLGVLRMIPDLTFTRLNSYPYLTMPVSQQVRVINQRF